MSWGVKGSGMYAEVAPVDTSLDFSLNAEAEIQILNGFKPGA